MGVRIVGVWCVVVSRYLAPMTVEYGVRGGRAVSEVNEPGFAWLEQEPHWLLIEDLMGGTYTMRKRGIKYLPQEPRERDDCYQNRLARSVCPPYYQRLERMLAGMLTRKPCRCIDVPDKTSEELFDVDQQGNDLNVWVYEMARKMIRYGHVGVLVDAPREGGRPYWCCYTPREILGFRTEVVDGKQEISQLRLMETVIEADGDSEYGEQQVEQIRVLTREGWRLFRKDKNNTYQEHDQGSLDTKLEGKIPFAVAYANQHGILRSRPPLEDIAELNLKAYQVQSDLDNQLHVSAVPLLALYAFPTGAGEVSVGPGEALAMPEEARAEYIEPGGKSYDAQFQRLDQVAKQINELGLAAVLGQKLTAETAESKRIDRSQGDSTMMMIAQSTQDMIDNCLKWHAALTGQKVSGSVLINRDFLGARIQDEDITALLQLYKERVITHCTLLKQLAQDEVLGDDFCVEQEVIDANNESRFLNRPLAREDIELLQKLHMEGTISMETLVNALKKGGVLEPTAAPDDMRVVVGAHQEREFVQALTELCRENILKREDVVSILVSTKYFPSGFEEKYKAPTDEEIAKKRQYELSSSEIMQPNARGTRNPSTEQRSPTEEEQPTNRRAPCSEGSEST